MLIYLDESGIHKQIDYSTFCLIFVNPDHRQRIETEILDIERKNRIKSFHWSDLPWKLRESFLNDISTLDFTAKIAVFNNPIKPKKALACTLHNLITEESIKGIYIEGKKPRWVERQIKKHLRDKGISIDKLRTVRHKSSPIVRLADALAGLNRSFYDNPHGRAKPTIKKLDKKTTTQFMGGQIDG